MSLILHTLSKNSLLDLSGNGYNGTLTAGTSKGFVKTGLGMGALDFDGSSTKVTVSASDIIGTGTISVSCWAYLRSYVQGDILDNSKFIFFTRPTNSGVAVNSNGHPGNFAGSGTISLNVWHHILITRNSNATGDCNIYVDGVLSGSANQNTSQPTAGTATILGNNTDVAPNALISNIKIWNTVLTQAERDKDYQEFQQAKQAGNITRTVSNFYYPDMPTLSETGLLGAWNMSPNNGVVTDISGNGFKGTVTGAVQAKGVMGNALQFSGSGSAPDTGTGRVVIGSTSGLNPTNAMTIQTRVKILAIPTTAGTIFAKGATAAGGGANHNYELHIDSTKHLVLQVSDNTNGRIYTSTSALSLGVWYDIVATWNGATDTFIFYVNSEVFAGSKTGTAISTLSTVERVVDIGCDLNNRLTFNGLIDTVKLYNITKIPTQVSEDYLKVAKQIELKEDFSDEGADGIVKTSANWQLVSGTYKIDELSIDSGNYNGLPRGTKYLQNVTDGILAIPQTSAYGTWEFDLYKGADGNTSSVHFTNNLVNGISGDGKSNSYRLNFEATELIRLSILSAGSPSTLASTAASYASNTTWYRIRITRSVLGVFTVYIKGGAFGNAYTLVSVEGGSGTNPVTDTTYTTSSYFVLDLDAGDRISGITKYFGVI